MRDPVSRPSSTDRDVDRRWLLVLALGLAIVLAGCASSEPDSEASAEPEREATVVFDFDGERDQDPQRWENRVAYDPDSRPAGGYEDVNASRPDAYTLHDLLSDVSEDEEISLEVVHEEGLGFHVATVEGVPAEESAKFWALHVDGERETAALNTITVEENETYEWRLQERTTDQTGTGSDGDRQTQGSEDTSGSGDPAPSEDGDGTDSEAGSGTGSGTDDGSTTTQEATMIVDYNGFRDEDPQHTEHSVRYDPNARPTWSLYEDAEADRPDEYILHDLVSDWSNQTGTDHIAREDDNDGFRLTTVDGVTAHSTQGGSWRWMLSVDGEPTTASLNTISVDPGTTYAWSFERISGGDGQ